MRKLTDRPSPIGSDDLDSTTDQEHARWAAKDRVAARRQARQQAAEQPSDVARVVMLGKPGELLSMSDGERWFHPYDGGSPIRITADNAHNIIAEGK